MTITVDVVGFLTFLIGAVGVIAVLFILVLAWQGTKNFLAGLKYDRTDREALRARWREIEAMLHGPGDMSLKLAVLEADKLLDHSLKALSFPGSTMGDRLRFAEYKYPELRKVWWAHKVRNQLAHEASYRLDRGVAKKAIAEFERALKRLGAI